MATNNTTTPTTKGSAFTKIFGETLLVHGEDGKVTEISTSSLADCEAVAIYFSAHWCPPCRGFTPALIDTYKRINQGTNQRFQIIFCSWDNKKEEFDEYFGTMPWAALPLDATALKDDLAAKYKVTSIPHLVVIGPNGDLITDNGREAVMSDREGKSFPWTNMAVAPPPSLLEKIRQNFVGYLFQVYCVYLLVKVFGQTFPEYALW